MDFTKNNIFLNNPRGPKDTVDSLFQGYGVHKDERRRSTKQDQVLDNNIVMFKQMEKHADEEHAEQQAQMVDEMNGGEMQKVKEADMRELKTNNEDSYWETSSQHGGDLRQDQQLRQEEITERQEHCAQSLHKINQRKQSHNDMLDNNCMLTQQASRDAYDLQQDVDEVDRKLRQTELCSGLDEQVADKVRAKRDAKQQSEDFRETWIWGSDAATQREDKAEKLRKDKECADYNRATVREHRELAKTHRHCDEGLNKENAAEGVFKQRLMEEEKERLLLSAQQDVADNMSAKQDAEEKNEDFPVTWVLGTDAVTQSGEAENLRKERECAEYNRATVREHKELEKMRKRCEEGENKENAAEGVFKLRLAEEEKERLLVEAQQELRAKQDAKEEKEDFPVTWVLRSDGFSEQRGDHAENLRREIECSDYNRATVREHEAFEKTHRHCDEGLNKENAAEGVFKLRLAEEEKERLLVEAQQELNGEAEKVKAKQDAKEEKEDFPVTWILRSDGFSEQRGDHAEKLRREIECSDYNRATVKEHEAFEKTHRHCDEGLNEENAAEGVFKLRLIEEEKKRQLVKAQQE